MLSAEKVGEAKLNSLTIAIQPKKVGLENPLPQLKTGQNQETRLFAPVAYFAESRMIYGGADETRTRDLRRDRLGFCPFIFNSLR